MAEPRPAVKRHWRELAEQVVLASSRAKSAGSGSQPFLEYMAAHGIGVTRQPSPASQSDVESAVVAALAGGGPKDVASLLSDVDRPPLSDLLHALTILEKYGLVRRSAEKGDDYFELSSAGARTAGAIGAGTSRP